MNLKLNWLFYLVSKVEEKCAKIKYLRAFFRHCRMYFCLNFHFYLVLDGWFQTDAVTFEYCRFKLDVCNIY